MLVSVIIPTFNGARKLPTVLRALHNQIEKDFEVLVVVDGSDDNTLQIIKKYESLFSYLKVIVQEHKGRSITKNNGAMQASNDVLIFYDDDMEPQPNSVQKHIEFHQSHRGFLSGNQIELESASKTDIQNYKANLTKVWTAKYPEGVSELTQQNLFFTAANCSIKKVDFHSLKGFDERLTDVEDFDLAYRALENGYPVYFDKSNKAIHHDPITCRSYIKRIRQYQQAQQKLSLLHKERRKMKFYLNPFKRILYFFFSCQFLPALIDRLSFIQLFPKKIRYKFYTVVIHSLGVVFPNRRLW